MRATGAVITLLGILALGFVALSYQGQAVKDAAVTNGTNETAAAYNGTTAVLEVSGQTLVTALLIGGLALIALMGIGILVAYGPRGR